jgi:hypothetical protein
LEWCANAAGARLVGSNSAHAITPKILKMLSLASLASNKNIESSQRAIIEKVARHRVVSGDLWTLFSQVIDGDIVGTKKCLLCSPRPFVNYFQ